jgi:hypothetical protein
MSACCHVATMLTLGALAGCSGAPKHGSGALAKQWCVDPAGVDSSVALEHARLALGDSTKQLRRDTVQAISFSGLEAGLMISFVNPNSLGGGGLVWVDAETGCAIVLRRYE